MTLSEAGKRYQLLDEIHAKQQALDELDYMLQETKMDYKNK